MLYSAIHCRRPTDDSRGTGGALASPGGLPRSWGCTALVLALGLLQWASPASAQTLPGPFLPMNDWWLHPTQGTLGVNRSGQTIYIDRDGDGANESAYDVPLINNEPLAATNLRLTPTREILYAFGDPCGFYGTMVYFFDVPAPPAPLTLIDSACIEWGIGSAGFYDTGLCTFNGIGLDCTGSGVSPNRIAYVADAGNVFNNIVKIYWFDLVNGTHAIPQPGFNSHLQLVNAPISPYGDAAFVEHGVDATADYTLIDLVAAPRFGIPISSIVGGPLFDLPPPSATAEMVDLGGGNWVIRVTHPDLARGTIDYAFTPAGGTPPDPDGACCFNDGSCSVQTAGSCAGAGGIWLGPETACVDCPPPTGACCLYIGCIPEFSESACLTLGGIWPGAGSTCADCPPTMRLRIWKTAPADVVEGTQMTYTLNYENSGGIAASDVYILDPLPTGTTFFSATAGGYLDGGYVRWPVGTLPIGAAGTVSFTVIVDCGITSVTNTGYRIVTGLQAFIGTPVTTTVLPTSADPVTVAITTTPSHDPLRRGDTLEHAIALTNSVAVDRMGITFAVDWGYGSEFDVMLDDAGGTVVYNGISSMRWTGGLPALGVATIRFRTRIAQCTTAPEERLNEGQTLEVRNTCGAVLGSGAPPAALPIQRPTALGLRVPAAGPSQFWLDTAHQALRAGGTEDIQLTVSNLVDAPQDVLVTHTIPLDLTPVGNPPFVPPTDPNAQYDQPSRTISWSGTLAPFSSALITYRVTLPVDVCRVDVWAGGDTGACSGDLYAYATLLLVPEPRTDAHLLHLAPFEGVNEAFPVHPLLCMPPEIFFGLGSAANGNIFVAGVPNFWFNAATLDFWLLDDPTSPVTFAEDVLGITPYALLRDVAVDPRDGTALFVGSNQVTTPLLGAIGRYDPVTGQATPLVAHEDLYDVERIVVGADGLIGTIGSQDGIVQIDPAQPNVLQVFSDPGVPFPTCIALDANGDYVVANSEATKKLARVDRQTGVYTVLVPDLDALVPVAGLIMGAAVDDNGDVYLSWEQGGMLVHLTVPPTAEPLSFFTWTADIEFIGGIPCPGPDRDGDGDVDMSDFEVLAGCVTGPANGLAPGCVCLDLDVDADVDLGDFAAFQRAFTGPHP